MFQALKQKNGGTTAFIADFSLRGFFNLYAEERVKNCKCP